MKRRTQEDGPKPKSADACDRTRRKVLTAGTVAGGALILGAPYIRKAEAADTQVWKVQSTWDAGTTGYRLFEEWANGFKEKSGGELELKPFPAKAVAADNNALFDAVRTGVLQAMNPFTLYWAGKIPASVFLSSYPAGPDQPSQWDTLFYGLGMLEATREIFARFGLYYVGPIQHDANIIHSKKPVTSLDQLKGMKVRLPGGMVAEVFERFGVSTTSMPGSDIYPALEKGTIDAADYVGPDGLPFTEGAPIRRFKNWLGVLWTVHTGSPRKGTSTAAVFAYHKSALGYASGAHSMNKAQDSGVSVAADITWHGDRAAHFVNHMMSGGAKLIDDGGVIKGAVDDTANLPTS